jgi:hypothetical protein
MTTETMNPEYDLAFVAANTAVPAHRASTIPTEPPDFLGGICSFAGKDSKGAFKGG